MCKCNGWRSDAVALPGPVDWVVGIGLFQNTDNRGLGELRLAAVLSFEILSKIRLNFMVLDFNSV